MLTDTTGTPFDCILAFDNKRLSSVFGLVTVLAQASIHIAHILKLTRPS